MRKEDILGECIDDILNGRRTLEECQTRYPKLARELEELLGVVRRIRASVSNLPVESRERARERLVGAMASGRSEKRSRTGRGTFAPRRILPVPIALGTALALLMTSAGVVAYASRNSLPDDALYPIKTGLEQVQLSLTVGHESKANLHLELSQRRIGEVITQSKLGRDIDASALETIATQIDAAIKSISRVPPEQMKSFPDRLQVVACDKYEALNGILGQVSGPGKTSVKEAIEMAQRANLICEVACANPEFLATSPSVKDAELEKNQFVLMGQVTEISGSTWNIGGLALRNMNSCQPVPPINSLIEVRGVVRGKQIFVCNIEYPGGAHAGTRIEGIFQRAEERDWYVSGIRVPQPQNLPTPEKGDRVELIGAVRDGSFIANDIESEPRDENDADEETHSTKMPQYESSGSSEADETEEAREARPVPLYPVGTDDEEGVGGEVAEEDNGSGGDGGEHESDDGEDRENNDD